MPRSLTLDRPRLPRHHALDLWMEAGHEVRLHTDGAAAFAELLADLAAAVRLVQIELYMLEPDEVGEAFADALERCGARGVEVRLVLDCFGSLALHRGHVLTDRLKAAGVQVEWQGMDWSRALPSLPGAILRWLRRRNLPGHLCSNHRKVFVIDGRVAWVSGRNVTRNYYALEPATATWADCGVRITGPGAFESAVLLDRNWHRSRSAALPFVRSNPRHDGALVALAFSRGSLRKGEASRRYDNAIGAAQSRVVLAQSYFLPDRTLMAALKRCAKTGVAVEVLISAPESSDMPSVALAIMYGAQRLLAAKVKVWMLAERTLHAKFGVIDGRWWSVGSTNLDPQSRRFLEANVVGLGAAEASALADYFAQLKAHAEPLTPGVWERQPWWRRWLGQLLWRVRYFL
jgi:cardiolipin synthase